MKWNLCGTSKYLVACSFDPHIVQCLGMTPVFSSELSSRIAVGWEGNKQAEMKQATQQITLRVCLHPSTLRRELPP